MKKIETTIGILIMSKATSQHRKLGYFLAQKIEDRGYRAFDYFDNYLQKNEGSYSIGGISFSISKKEIKDNDLTWILTILGLI
jgi:hypothetical protein